MQLSPGTKVAERYVIEKALAKGGMGAVFVALDEQMGVRVALKVTVAGGSAADELSKRFQREARIGNRLGARHQGFVRCLGWGRVDDVQLYLVMDLVEGARPLDLRQGTIEERLGRWRRAAELVHHAHEQGVIHRDLKPANFLQAPDGAIYLTDFGLAKVVGEAAADEPDQPVSLTMTGVGFGTPPYMPPEQLEDAKHADQRADVFALGCMLFEVAALRLPYPGPTPTGVMGAHLKVRAGVVPAPRPRDIDPSVPEALDQACASALELELERRCPSVATLLARLDGSAPTRLEPAPESIGAAVTAPPPAEPGPDAASAGLGRPLASSVRPGPGGPSAPLLSNLPTGDGVPTDQPRAPTPEHSPPPTSPRPRGKPRAWLVAAGLLLACCGAVATDMAGLRQRLREHVARGNGTPSSTEQGRPGTLPQTRTSPPPPSSEVLPLPQTRLVALRPADGAIISELMVDVSGQVEPPTATVRVAGIACPVSDDGTFDLHRLSLDPGANLVTVEVQPSGPGQEPLRHTLTLTADPDDPRLVLEAPADGLETAEATVMLRGRVDDATAVEVSVGDQAVTRVRAGGGTFSVAVPLPTVGRQALKVVAKDAGGRTTRLTRAVLRRAPRLEVMLDAPDQNAPGGWTETNATRVRVAGRVMGDATPGSLEVRVDGAALRLDAGGAFDQALALAEGEHALEVVAVGRGPTGEPVEARAMRRIRVDRTPPFLRLVTPADGAQVDEGPLDVRAEASDAAAWVDVTPGTGSPVRVHRGQAFNGRVTLAEGATEVVLVAVDPAGNRSEARRRVTRAVTWTPGRPVPWSRGPTRLPAGVKRGKTEGEYVNERDGSALLYVPPGTFRMGSDSGDGDEKPVHQVRLTRGYFVGKHEVTWGQFRAFCREQSEQQLPTNVVECEGHFEAPDSHPVFNVTWHDARAYCEWAGVRLPTEAEWEYAARGSDGRSFPWGNEEPGTTHCNMGLGKDLNEWRKDGYLITAPVGSFPAGVSPFGALDMAGNVWEWVQDWHGKFSSAAQTDPVGPAAPSPSGYPWRVARGGSLSDAAAVCRATRRNGGTPDSRYVEFGFRVARSAEDP